MSWDEIDTVVIGGGQAGLAAGYCLRLRGLPFVILDENQRVGDAWRNRWDSLGLFTPGRFKGLPGMPFPGPSSAFPTKNEVADYFEAYAHQFALPIRTGIKVERISAASVRFEVFCRNQVLSARNVLVATGAFHHPRLPGVASALTTGRSSNFTPRDTANRPNCGKAASSWSAPATRAPRSPSSSPRIIRSGCQVPTQARSPPVPGASPTVSSRRSCG